MLPWHESAGLQGGLGERLTVDQVQARVAALLPALHELAEGEVVGLLGDNSVDWIVADLACAQAGRALVPVPAFFTPQQVAHVCQQGRIRRAFHKGQLMDWSGGVAVPVQAMPWQAPVLPAGTQKITFTSGTTGQAKGICLTWAQQMDTARSLVAALSGLQIRVHLNLLPLPVLLENIAGVYAPLMMGATVVCPPLAEVGLSGSSQFDPARCAAAIAQHQAESVILLPQMLHGLVAWVGQDADRLARLKTLKFIAVGGAPTPRAVLDAATSLGLPVFEGYGLTECASVVCLNTPQARLVGSVGKPLPGLSVGLMPDGEIWVSGRSYAGVLGSDQSPALTEGGRLLTGDLGTWVESDGQRFMQITGRKKNVLITAFGRNVSPEWPERLLLDTGLFAQAVVMGDGQSQLRVALVPASASVTPQQAAHVLDSVNQQLPDYARLQGFLLRTEAFTPANGLATPNGRPLRQRIEQECAAFSFHGLSGV